MSTRGTLPSAITEAEAEPEPEPEPELVKSPLEREITINGTTAKICIYRSEVETGWILEVEDHLGGSTVWDDRFATDKEALDAAMAVIEEDGIESFAHATASYVIERWFGRLKQFRRIATRYDKTQSSYGGFIALGASQVALSGWRA